MTGSVAPRCLRGSRSAPRRRSPPQFRVEEAPDHDVADVLEAVGAQKVAMPVASHEMISGNGRQCGRSGRHASDSPGGPWGAC